VSERLGARRTVCLLLYYGIAQYVPKRWFLARPGIRLRAWLAKRIFAECGGGLDLGPRVYIGNGSKIHVGTRSAINAWSRIEAADHLYIGDNVDIGPQVIIYTSDHEFHRRDRLIQQQGFSFAPVRIGNDVYIGARVIVQKGVTIHDGAVVGSAAVVTRDVPPYTIVAGVPARAIGQRG
jgi:acetyltransferase-like isoleucine patch superfamily enzyme